MTRPVIDLGAHFHPARASAASLSSCSTTWRAWSTAPDRSVIVTRQAERLAEMWGEQHT